MLEQCYITCLKMDIGKNCSAKDCISNYFSYYHHGAGIWGPYVVDGGLTFKGHVSAEEIMLMINYTRYFDIL